MVLGPRSPILCHTCATNCATICGTCGTKFFCATFCGTYFLYFTCDPFYSSHFWIPDPLFCASKVPQNEAHEAHSLNVPQFEAHNFPDPCSSIPFLYYRHLTRPPSFPPLLYLIVNSAHPSYRSPTLPQPLISFPNLLLYVIQYWKYSTVSKGSYTPGAA